MRRIIDCALCARQTVFGSGTLRLQGKTERVLVKIGSANGLLNSEKYPAGATDVTESRFEGTDFFRLIH